MSMYTKETLERARNITKTFGRGFYRASLLFPKDIREATWIVYAFVRIPDEMVDSQPDEMKALRDITEYKDQWARVLRGENQNVREDVLVAAKHVFDTYTIPYEYSHIFLASMEQDLVKKRYQNYEELESYMYGSASVIGMMMSHIMGFKEGALPHAKALGEAFQLINFLRDSRDDFEVRGRVYLPQDEMARFGVSDEYIKHGIVDEKWNAFMAFEVARAYRLLEEGLRGIPRLKKGKRAVYASYLIYHALLDEMTIRSYDVFSSRVVVSPFHKTMLLWKAIWKRNL